MIYYSTALVTLVDYYSTVVEALIFYYSKIKTFCRCAVNLWLLFLDYNNVYSDLVFALHRESSCQFVASVLGISIVVGILGNL